MKKLYYGNGQVQFQTWDEYYFALGFLANFRFADIRWEHNEEQGAWGSEGRIHCLVPQSQFPPFFRFTAGVGKVYARVNCNEYVETLVDDHGFSTNGRTQDFNVILRTVPPQYVQAFLNGYDGKCSF